MGVEHLQGGFEVLWRIWRICFSRVLKFTNQGMRSKYEDRPQLKAEMAQDASHADAWLTSNALCNNLEQQRRDRMVHKRLKAGAVHENSEWLCVVSYDADKATF